MSDERHDERENLGQYIGYMEEENADLRQQLADYQAADEAKSIEALRQAAESLAVKELERRLAEARAERDKAQQGAMEIVAQEAISRGMYENTIAAQSAEIERLRKDVVWNSIINQPCDHCGKCVTLSVPDELATLRERLEAAEKRKFAPEPQEETRKPRDWRIGLTVKAKYRTDPLYYEHGDVVDVLPNGTGGIDDKDGVLCIRLHSSGNVILRRAGDWITA